MGIHRRKLLGYAVGAAGMGAFGAKAYANAPARSIALANLHTGESLKATYWEAGEYVPDALTALNHVLRDHRTGEVHAMAPSLFDLVTALRGRLETDTTVSVISGYRSPATNAALHAHSEGVASHSLHMLGEAIDLRIAGVDLDRVRDAALSLQRGGVGFYPQSQFVHVDIGRVRRWQAILTPRRNISAGVLAYRWRDGAPEFLLVHPGGPYWRGKDLAAWSVPKGLAEDGEDLARAAVREFHEELGIPVTTPLASLTACRQPGGKVVQAWMTEADPNLTRFRSNLFEMEWPPGSGTSRAFPEVDRAAWFPADEALARIHRGQRPILLEALTRLGVPPPE